MSTERLRVCVQGIWHLGAVTAACLASHGHLVVGLDDDEVLIEGLVTGRAPLEEKGLDDLIRRGIDTGSLRFTTSYEDAIPNCDILLVTYDTPVNDMDEADTSLVVRRIEKSLDRLPPMALVIVSSQLPVGTIGRLELYSQTNLSHLQLNFCSMPENLRLGTAIENFLRPDRIIVGVRSETSIRPIEMLLNGINAEKIFMSIESAEMTKHAINAFLASSITFANEIATLCEFVGADPKEVETGLKSERRIGRGAYLAPGGPFEGGTLARDVKFLSSISEAVGRYTPLLSSISASNEEHKGWIRRKILENLPILANKTLVFWGLTYKAGTNTLRRSLALNLIEWLLEYDCRINLHDPNVIDLPDSLKGRVRFFSDPLESIVGADGLILNTGWPIYKNMAAKIELFAKSDLIIFDANRYIIEKINPDKLKYISVGSAPSSVKYG